MYKYVYVSELFALLLPVLSVLEEGERGIAEDQFTVALTCMPCCMLSETQT